MIRKDEGVVLKTARSGETSKLVTFLGRENGKIRLLAKGALAGKSPFRGALEPGNHLEVVFYHKEGRTLYFLKEVHVHSSLETDRGSLSEMAAALAVVELLDRVCFWESPDERVVSLVVDYLRCPPGRDPVLSFLVFEAKLLSVLGALPDFSVCVVCGVELDDGFFHPAEGTGACTVHSEAASRRFSVDENLVELWARLVDESFDDLREVDIDRVLRKRLGTVMHWTYTFHVNNYHLPESLKLIPKE